MHRPGRGLDRHHGQEPWGRSWNGLSRGHSFPSIRRSISPGSRSNNRLFSLMMTSTNPHHSYGEEEQFENEDPHRDAFGNTWSGVVGTHYREVYHHNPRQTM